MNYMRLLKLLYITERETLAEAGVPLTGSRLIAMKSGPVLEDVFSLIRGQHPNSPDWSRFFAVENYHIKMIADPGMGRLTKFFAKKLSEVSSRHVRDDEWDLVEITHRLPEWKKNDPGDSSKEIPLADLMAAIGRSADTEKIIADARASGMAAAVFLQDSRELTGA